MTTLTLGASILRLSILIAVQSFLRLDVKQQTMRAFLLSVAIWRQYAEQLRYLPNCFVLSVLRQKTRICASGPYFSLLAAIRAVSVSSSVPR